MFFKVLFLISIMISFFTFSGCAPKKESIPVAKEGIDIPVQQFNDATLYFYSKQKIQWKLDAETMRKPLTDTGSILVVPVRLQLFDSVGTIRTRVLADSGLITTRMDSYTVWGNVFIRTKDSMVVQTEKLMWFKNNRKVTSDTYVQIETIKGDVLRGKGLDATEDFSRFSFKQDVTGAFPDFKKRLENKDEGFF
ncbi:MAG TPA: LPS export ABC transporter periplasmic protein LptC [Chitinispirillaceae bacterium]|nr:LPS export ABC transporter periplasmic protein LptC [Chitinispirillaceae bacterium]